MTMIVHSYDQFWHELEGGQRKAHFTAGLYGSIYDYHGVIARDIPLTVETVLEAYSKGYFPWSGDAPVPWCAPHPRMLIELNSTEGLHVSRTLCKLLRRGRYHVRFDTQFETVMAACANIPRSHESGTWITPHMQQIYGQLHSMGVVHSVEVYEQGTLCGGLYGLTLGRLFCGESMFSKSTSASKVALFALAQRCRALGIRFIDCQAYTPHLESMGAQPYDARSYSLSVQQLTQPPSQHHDWSQSSHTKHPWGYDPP